MSLEENQKAYQTALKRLKRAEKNLREKHIKLQSECLHDEVLEGESTPSTYHSYSDPPFRVCTACGYAEEGWGCGYSFLDDSKKVLEVKREKAEKYLLGGIHSNTSHTRIRHKNKGIDSLLKQNFKFLDKVRPKEFRGKKIFNKSHKANLSE